MKRLLSLAAAFMAIAVSLPASAQSPIQGLWLNPRRTVAVRTGDCAGKLCGWIVWAAAQARADARDSGIDQLIGIELLENYAIDDRGGWSGRVYVPDMDRDFSSTITQRSATELKVEGCLIGGFICKSQLWERIEQVPHA